MLRVRHTKGYAKDRNEESQKDREWKGGMFETHAKEGMYVRETDREVKRQMKKGR